ncbi:hypothetical protein BCV73_05915 [Paenibacillus sp. SSG-1]|uniref:O-antigen ligase-related domain-containing protein n=2 Tax=Paenibacillus TaxID=44249 RepID=A0ABQ4L9H7_9BACL|nr:O-antigen ligase family protein [Paenibacillus cineris]OXL82671.1 hypothetical protein BCV73_05915 [Paenibacillus sp. SSG-1]GIO53031.1 hypothetical protein J21TS7_13490 [Paenibacillus cineris]
MMVLLLIIPVLVLGFLVAVHIIPAKGMIALAIGMVLLAAVSGIQLSAGFRDVHVDLTFFVLMAADLSLIVHLMLRRRIHRLGNDSSGLARLQTVSIFIVLLLLVLVFQGFVSEIYESGLYVYHLNVYVNILLMASLLYMLARMQLNASWLLQLIVVYSLANSLLGILQYVTNRSYLLFAAEDSINYYEGVKVAKRVVGFVGASNGAGNLAAVLFPVLLMYFLNKRTFFGAAALLLNLLFLFLTFTRIGYLSVCVQFLVFLLTGKIGVQYQLLKKLGIVMFAALAGLIIYQMYFDQLNQILFLDRGNTESHRFVQFYEAFGIMKEHMGIGLGAGQYIPYMQIHHGVNDIALHSQFLNAFVELGTIGGILFFTTYVLLFLWSLRLYKGERWFPLCLFIGNFIVANFNPNQYYSLCVYTFFIIAFGFVFARRGINRRQNGPMEASNCPNQRNPAANIMLVNEGV